MLVSSKPLKNRRETVRYPFGLCGSDVGNNSVPCSLCKKRVYKKFSGPKIYASVPIFRCSDCVQSLLAFSSVAVEMDDDIIYEVENFCNLTNVLNKECSADAVSRSRISEAGAKWRVTNNLLCKKGILLNRSAQVYGPCIRSVILHGSET